MTGSLAFDHPDEGVLYVVTGPSGVGKSTLVKRAMARVPGLEFSISATTRPAREGEVDGQDYHFLSQTAFDALIERGALLEHASVYSRSYGTPRRPVVEALREGRSILLDIDLLGARQVKAAMPQSVSIFLLPPSLRELESRLRGRGTDADDVIERRMRGVNEQVIGCGEFDYLVVNDDLTTAHAVFEGVLLAEMSRRSRRSRLVGAMCEQAKQSG